MFLTLLVSNFSTFKLTKEEQFENTYDISMTLFVLNLFKDNFDNL